MTNLLNYCVKILTVLSALFFVILTGWSIYNKLHILLTIVSLSLALAFSYFTFLDVKKLLK